MSDDKSKSTAKRRARTAGKADRPPKSFYAKLKPYDDFPLTAHPAGYWAKSIRGKLHYFGRWGRRVNGKMVRVEGDGWQAALDEFERTQGAPETSSPRFLTLLKDR